MPAKAIPLIVAAVVATGIVIYQNRDQLFEIYDRGREKLSKSLHKLADSVGPRQRERPYGGRGDLHDEEERDSLVRGQAESSRTTARGRRSLDTNFRQRGAAGNGSQREQVVFCGPSASGGIPLQRLNSQSSRRQSSIYDKELPPPPLPPRRKQSPPPPPPYAPPPSESGYGTERTHIVSPAVLPHVGPPPQHTFTDKSKEANALTRPFATAEPAIHEVQSEVVRSAMVMEPVTENPMNREDITTEAMSIETLHAVAASATGDFAAVSLAASIVTSQEIYPPPVPSSPTLHSFSDETEVYSSQELPSVESSQYRSIHEWATNASHSIPSSPGAASEASDAVSVVAADEPADYPDIVSEFDTASDGEFSEVGSWTEVGSETSENDH